MHETPVEVERLDAPTERHVHASRTVVSALRRALNAARNRQNMAAAQAAKIEKVLTELTGGTPAGNGRDADAAAVGASLTDGDSRDDE